MKFSSLQKLFGQKKQSQFRENGAKTIADHNREALVRLGRDQFKKLVDKGLSVPVVLL